MNTLDYAVLIGSVLLIALYGILRTRGRRNLHDYLRGQKRSSWFVVGLSVMATQASAITFLSTPGQGYAGGMAFVQNYFAIPLALVIIAAVFLPIYRRFNVYTAYEYLGNRFDMKTRLLAASLFLFQRALAAGITIYAPAIVLCTVFGWPLSITIIGSGLVVLAYTVVGGSDAVTHTQKYQIGIIFVGMIAAFFILLSKIPCSFTDALALAGHFGKTNAVSFKPDLKERYTVWTGMLGGIFLMLSYFGTDQSQVQRYISGDDLRESKLGLMFNALFKIPMQFFILLLGVMLFVFYLFNPSPLFFNTTVLNHHLESQQQIELIRADGSRALTLAPEGVILQDYNQRYKASREDALQSTKKWIDARQSGDPEKIKTAMAELDKHHSDAQSNRQSAIDMMKRADPAISTNDNDYVFITFILDHLPNGLIGLLVACFFFATLSSKAAELNALASISTVDFYRYIIHPPDSPTRVQPPAPTESAGLNANSSDATLTYATPIGAAPVIENPQDRHYVLASKAFTIFWGLLAIGFALFLHMAENLIQASNIIGSLFSGCVLGIFLLAFFFKWVKGHAAFYGALAAQVIVFVVHGLNYWGITNIAYLWYNLIGAVGCILFAILLQPLFPSKDLRGFPIVPDGG